MTLPDFESMSIDEIVEYRVKLRGEMREIRERIVASNGVFERKIAVRDLSASLRLDATGLTTKETQDLIDLVKKASQSRMGDVTVEVPANEELKL